MTANLDAGSTQRLAWASHLAKRLLKTEAYDSVLIRRAVRVYAERLDGLLTAAPEELEREAELLTSAARGETGELPEGDVIQVPIKPYSTIQWEAKAQQREELYRAMEAWDRLKSRGGRGG
jgi:hypothetical protein